MDKNHLNNNQTDGKKETDAKIENMKTILYDADRCKEIAQKLCAYIKES